MWFSLGACCICIYKKTKRKRYRSVTPQKPLIGYYKMILRVRLIGAVLPQCGQIPVTK